ncbi:hypothetical protein [Colwellia sp. RSH04]|uniref:hypothetical protein n=1 Tax=Colwellia sp. RSH04 TaxID=2305464 RepID=UPI000E57974F|nr:hypothetical protein [Colwellia sp. RSH04]RHW77208.1 hypothetical protein D1094_04800 [Colwellia sp. RSH04]
MLINTVILFIKDLLPIFVLLCLISTCIAPNRVTNKKRLYVCLSSVVGIFATFYYLPMMGELFDGMGIEIIKTLELGVVYFFLLIGCSSLLSQNTIAAHQSNLTIVGLIIFTVINASEFITFLDSYLTSRQSIKDVVAGLSIGLGICLSFSALLYLSLHWFIKKEFFIFVYIAWALFLSGQISQVVNLLQQVDILKSSGALWDSTKFVKDSSEYGHLLKTLFGYEASPSLQFILLYTASLLLFIVIFFIKSSKKHHCDNDSFLENQNVV